MGPKRSILQCVFLDVSLGSHRRQIFYHFSPDKQVLNHFCFQSSLFLHFTFRFQFLTQQQKYSLFILFFFFSIFAQVKGLKVQFELLSLLFSSCKIVLEILSQMLHTIILPLLKQSNLGLMNNQTIIDIISTISRLITINRGS